VYLNSQSRRGYVFDLPKFPIHRATRRITMTKASRSHRPESCSHVSENGTEPSRSRTVNLVRQGRPWARICTTCLFFQSALRHMISPSPSNWSIILSGSPGRGCGVFLAHIHHFKLKLKPVQEQISIAPNDGWRTGVVVRGWR
jgi:hypothetical protein